MKRSENLREYMQAHLSDYLSALEGAVRRETPTEGDRADLDICRAYFAELFRLRRFPGDGDPQPGPPLRPSPADGIRR